MPPSFSVFSPRPWSAARGPARTRLLASLLAAALLACGPTSAGPPGDGAARAPGEAALEERLLAPCCWIQTLDVHESELATSLRAEIHERLRRGEPDAIIEDDLAIRFGERIRAVPRGHDPRGAVPLLVGMGMILSAAGLFWLLRRWSRRPSHPPDSRPAMPAGDEYEARLDDELRRLDEP